MDIPVEKVRSKWQQPIFRTGLIAITLIAAYIGVQTLDPAVPSINEGDIWISTVKRGEFTRSVRGVGVLVPAEIRWLAAVSAGRVERVLIKPGARVSKDTVIAELSNPEITRQLEQARWELDAAEANLLALEAQLREQQLEHELLITQARMALEAAQLRERAEQPLADKFIISELDFATTQLTTKQRRAELDIHLQTQTRRSDIERARLAAEQANVRKYKNMVMHLETQTAALNITSDIEGVLQEISVEVGQRVEVGGNIARVARPDSLLAELQVQENMVQDLRLGLPVSIDTRNGLVDGSVKRIDPRVLNGNVQIDVELHGSLPSGARPDLSITGTIVVEQLQDTLYINRPAGTPASTEASLFTLTPDQSRAEQRVIALGKASISSIQVLDGLTVGDAVIVSDMSDLKQHPAIRIIK